MTTAAGTEEKIKAAAREIFLKKGFAATRTRDIAEHADINIALLNYYFRSKEKLFQQIMMETLSTFFGSLLQIFMDRESALQTKFEQCASQYIDLIKQQPDIPMFILSELRAQPEAFVQSIAGNARLKDLVIYEQIVAEMDEHQQKAFDPVHIMINVMSLTLFPFVARPMLQTIGAVNPSEFDDLMEKRKQLIPQWIMEMLK